MGALVFPVTFARKSETPVNGVGMDANEEGIPPRVESGMAELASWAAWAAAACAAACAALSKFKVSY